MRIAARAAAGGVAQMQEAHAKALSRAQAAAVQAKEQLEVLVEQLTNLAGRSAVPPEG
jgi:hypothetical protein